MVLNVDNVELLIKRLEELGYIKGVHYDLDEIE